MGADFSFSFPLSVVVPHAHVGRRSPLSLLLSLQLAVNKRGLVSHAYPNDRPYIVQVA